MAQTDWQIEVRDKTYFARSSDTTGWFWSPLFESLEDFKKWCGEEPVFEHQPLVLTQADFDLVKEALSQLNEGVMPKREALTKVDKIYELISAMLEKNVKSDSLIREADKLGIGEYYEMKFNNRLNDVLYFLFKSQELAKRPELLKLCGFFFGDFFGRSGILDKDFATVYRENVKVQEND